MGQGLKNRGYSKKDVDDRRKAIEECTEASLEHVSSYSFDPEVAKTNIENMIGCVQVPLGFVGPMLINGDHAKDKFLIPMATTEGALLASVNRGTSLISKAGGANVVIVKDEMTRAPVFRVNDVRHGVMVTEWVKENFATIKEAAESTTGHGKLLSIEPFSAGRNLYLRFSYFTGDALGMNMATIATEAASKIIAERTDAVMISVSGNLCTDKKPAAINFLRGRGKMVLADVTIPRELVEERLHTTPETVVDACIRKNNIGSSLAGSLGSNAHMANMIAAVFIATGQDPAQVVEGSMGTTTAEVVEGDLYISVRLPALEVGTVGGGTRLPTQAEALSIIDCVGAGKAKKFAEIIGAVVLAGELSTIGAQAAGHLGKAHKELGR